MKSICRLFVLIIIAFSMALPVEAKADCSHDCDGFNPGVGRFPRQQFRAPVRNLLFGFRPNRITPVRQFLFGRGRERRLARRFG